MLVHSYRETATNKCYSNIKDSKGGNLSESNKVPWMIVFEV